MPELPQRLDQHPSKLAAALVAAMPAQRDRCVRHQGTADDRWVEALRAGCADDARDPVVRSLARWRAAMVDEA